MTIETTDEAAPPVTGCPACGTTDIRLVRTYEAVERHRVVAFRTGEGRPTFVVEPVVHEASRRVVEARVECVNGHAHPDRIGFDLEWGAAG